MWGIAAIYSTGVLILLRRSISNRLAVFLKPASCCTNRVISGGVAFFALCLLHTFPAHAATPEPFKITLVLSEDGGSYQEFSTALHSKLSNDSFNLRVIVAGQLIPKSDLAIAVGTKAATAVAGSNAPAVLNVLIPKAGHEKLLGDFPQRRSSDLYTAIFLDQPMTRQVHLIFTAFPEKHRIGILHSSLPEDIVQLRREMESHGMRMTEEEVSPGRSLAEALHALLQKSEVLLALPDATVYNSATIRNILLTTYRSGVPVIGYSPSYAKAGAACALFSNPAQIASQSAAMISHFRETYALPTPQYPQEFEVMVNQQVVRSLGLQVKSPTELHDEVEVMDRMEP